MKSVARLLAELAAPDEGVRVEASKALGQLRTKRALDHAIPALCALVRGASDGGTRWAAAYALTWHRDGRAVAPLLEALGDRREEPKVRGQAAEGLGQLLAGRDDDGPLGVLRDALGAPEPEVRFWSAFALGQAGDRRAIPELARLAVTDHAVVPGWWAVSKEAAAALAAIQRRDAV